MKEIRRREAAKKVESRKKQSKRDLQNDNKEGVSYAYIVECGDGSLYTGWTNHLEKRMKIHNAGKGAKYTRSRLPVRLVHYEVFLTKQEAMKREYVIKQLARKDKLLLIKQQSATVRKQCERIAKENYETKISKVL